MGLMHCPLCVGLAVLSVARALAHLRLGWLLVGFGHPPRRGAAAGVGLASALVSR